ncbi:quinone oxidoreductase family protein [Undibacterium sp. Ji50W]|uniref:quinone oxidoreductase family protein n=1 Tax=Undibacterium sp. Ji50W TaxID=3413041 RepID=UPI003BF14A1E
MKAAIIVEAGQPPVYGDFTDPQSAPGKSLIRVTASSISHVTRSRASGQHYSADNTTGFIPGIDGTGIDEDNQRVYFLLPDKPYGAMAECCVVDKTHCIALPDSLSDAEAAAMAITGMSSWAALVERADLRAGETVLINGATGASGRLAIQIAKHLGAKKVIATGRNSGVFDDLRLLGADVTIDLSQDKDALEQAFKNEFEQGVHIVLDYLWGLSAELLLVTAARASPDGMPVRFVQIGSVGGADIKLPGAVLRSSALQLMGSGIGSVAFPKLFKAIKSVLNTAPLAGFKIAVNTMPLADVSRAWAIDSADARIVLLP